MHSPKKYDNVKSKVAGNFKSQSQAKKRQSRVALLKAKDELIAEQLLSGHKFIGANGEIYDDDISGSKSPTKTKQVQISSDKNEKYANINLKSSSPLRVKNQTAETYDSAINAKIQQRLREIAEKEKEILSLQAELNQSKWKISQTTAVSSLAVNTQSPLKGKIAATTYSVAHHKRTDSGTMEKIDKMAQNHSEFKSFEQQTGVKETAKTAVVPDAINENSSIFE